MRVEFTPAQVRRLAENPLPWFDSEIREALGRPPLPIPEVDASTGNLYYDSEEVDATEVWFADLLKAGWAYVDTDPTRAGLEALQAAYDWQAWESAIAAHEPQTAELTGAVMAYLAVVSISLGVALP